VTYVARRALTFTGFDDDDDDATDATRLAASASRPRRRDRTRRALSSSVTQSLRSWRQCSPCGANATPRPSRVSSRMVAVRGRVGRRRHDDGELAQAEQHERAVPPRQVTHGAVRERAHEVVQAADERELPWAGRWFMAVVASPELDGEERQQQDRRQEEVMVG
jgi:hypothetical protein